MSSFSGRAVRINGLTQPYTPTQISTWFFLPMLVLEFLFFVSPILPLEASIPCTIFFCGFAASSTFYGVMAMKIDPSDPRLLHVNDNDGGTCTTTAAGANRYHWDPEEPTKQCWICDIQVGEKSMHCKFCNKCVDHFDHHCMWLNTCIGKANYPYFFRTMVSISIMLFIQAAIHIALILDIYLGNGASKKRAEDWFDVNTTIPVVVVMGIFLLFNLVSLSLIGQLLLFHLKLRREGITTYQFIVRDNQNRRERTRKENDLKRKRHMAIGKAKEDGNQSLVFQLRIGGLLREKCGLTCCDPLKINNAHESSNDEEIISNNNDCTTNGLSNGHAITTNSNNNINDTTSSSVLLEEEDNDEESTKD